jgi:Rps23 Pro-64 3,4-dihydroxylase Tpa1-like proline 4-hydroxylase
MVEFKGTELAPGIVVFSGVYSDYADLPEMIEDAVRYKAISWSEATVSEGKNKNARDTDTIVVPSNLSNGTSETPRDVFYRSMLDIINNALKRSIDDYMANYGILYSDFEEYSILKYGKNQKFVNHIDDHPKYHRRISMVYYMNDSYEGGEIEFPRFNIKYKPKANDLIMFPSGYAYNHSVHPVISGTRYAIVGWIK